MDVPVLSEQLPPQVFTTGAQLLDLTDKKLVIVLRDGRKLIGTLRSYDQYVTLTVVMRLLANLVLQDTVERLYSDDLYADVPRGCYIVRGENVLLLGEIVRTPDNQTAYILSGAIITKYGANLGYVYTLQDLDKEDDLPLKQATVDEIYDAQRAESAHKKQKEKKKARKLHGLGFEAENELSVEELARRQRASALQRQKPVSPSMDLDLPMGPALERERLGFRKRSQSYWTRESATIAARMAAMAVESALLQAMVCGQEPVATLPSVVVQEGADDEEADLTASGDTLVGTSREYYEASSVEDEYNSDEEEDGDSEAEEEEEEQSEDEEDEKDDDDDSDDEQEDQQEEEEEEEEEEREERGEGVKLSPNWWLQL
ncbi:U6 snRNA-associated Sm-like protein [Drechslerella dactyloides]|uniref:U6 snRNA-associated Sm-like protein n=1 Tax=Drechslerella dactyloides TaxID=74499 RepID=A0AAD6J1E8_DREDA|nr:U6 snRNA-associated Sm-like protein [Drechslerella dactyloides]